MGTEALGPFAAVVLAGGTAARLGGFDKASVELGGRTFLEWALDAVVDAVEVVVVGEQVPTERPVTFVREDPREGGPVAGLLTGFDVLLGRNPQLVVLAVDMPRVTSSTVRRLLAIADGHDGAVLVGPDGRRQLAFAVDAERLAAVRPGLEEQHGFPVHRLLGALDLAEVAAEGEEHRDVDTWEDLRDVATPAGVVDLVAGTWADPERDARPRPLSDRVGDTALIGRLRFTAAVREGAVQCRLVGGVAGRSWSEISETALRDEAKVLRREVRRVLGRRADRAASGSRRWEQPWGRVEVVRDAGTLDVVLVLEPRDTSTRAGD